MANINDRVKYFMDNLVVYDNPNDVEMLTHPDDAVLVAADWPGHKTEGFNLEFIFECETIAEFTQVFGIKKVKDLERITPDFLVQLYHQGKAEVWCSFDIVHHYYPLEFFKRSQGMIAIDDDEVEHTLLVPLETPQQFMDYTHQRYLQSKIPGFNSSAANTFIPTL
jgi:hypothetical protein